MEKIYLVNITEASRGSEFVTGLRTPPEQPLPWTAGFFEPPPLPGPEFRRPQRRKPTHSRCGALDPITAIRFEAEEFADFAQYPLRLGHQALEPDLADALRRNRGDRAQTIRDLVAPIATVVFRRRA
jgi:hypothetical protein